ncbi:MAG: hypothetical protein Q9186_000669 [Xanthomendoza sp. 1 TL-2023]
MQYVRSLGGSVSKTWNSINPATLSGAIDVIVVEQEDELEGSLACSPFHVRFGKFSLLRPYEKKVEFKVNCVKQNHAMKLGEGGEAFFVFETSDQIPESLQTSPVVSPAASPQGIARDAANVPSLQEPDFLDINIDGTSDQARRHERQSLLRPGLSITQRSQSDYIGSDGRASQANQTAKYRGSITPASSSSEAHEASLSNLGPYAASELPAGKLTRSASEELLCLPTRVRNVGFNAASSTGLFESLVPPEDSGPDHAKRSSSPPPISNVEAVDRAKSLSTKLSMSNIRSRVTETGDLMLDMTGYKTREDEALRAESIARKILAEELEGNYDIGALIGADEQGNLWIYSSEEAKEAARQQIRTRDLIPQPIISDVASDPGHQSDEDSSTSTAASPVPSKHQKTRSEASPAGLITPPQTPPTETSKNSDPNRNYAKTLRLTSDQLKALTLKPGSNVMSFSVNRATCSAFMYYWTYDVPIVISDIDGTITKSDALGHVLNMIGRDWTHLGVAKLYTDIVANGYNILYLTSRSVGQADTTRTYLNGVTQEGFKLPKGPVIMSPDRTITALRRELYLRKPEVFKMACLRDILNLFDQKCSPFYAGFGNRLTDALSYRSVNIPSARIFTINSNAEVSLDLLTLNKYKNSYVTMRELVDHFFPPVGLLVIGGGEEFTDFNYWRDAPLDVEDFSDSDCSDKDEIPKSQSRRSIRSEDEGSEGLDDDDQTDALAESYTSQFSAEEDGGPAEAVLARIVQDDANLGNDIAESHIRWTPSAAANVEQLLPAEVQIDLIREDESIVNLS